MVTHRRARRRGRKWRRRLGCARQSGSGHSAPTPHTAVGGRDKRRVRNPEGSHFGRGWSHRKPAIDPKAARRRKSDTPTSTGLIVARRCLRKARRRRRCNNLSLDSRLGDGRLSGPSEIRAPLGVAMTGRSWRSETFSAPAGAYWPTCLTPGFEEGTRSVPSYPLQPAHRPCDGHTWRAASSATVGTRRSHRLPPPQPNRAPTCPAATTGGTASCLAKWRCAAERRRSTSSARI